MTAAAMQPSESEPTEAIELSDFERRFVDEVCVSPSNRSAAARRAGAPAKSAKYAARDAWAKPHVRDAVAVRFKEIADGVECSAQAVIAELAKLAFMPIKASTAPSKVRALELLGKQHRLFVDRSEVSAAFDVNLHVSGARERIASKLARLIGA